MSEAMENTAATNTGWKPIPLPLKILFVVFILWLVGAVMNLPNLMENGLPLFGNFVFGMSAALIVLLLNILGPTDISVRALDQKIVGPKMGLRVYWFLHSQ